MASARRAVRALGQFRVFAGCRLPVEPGLRGNEDQEQLTLTATVKQQVGPDDSVWAQVTYYDAESGDACQPWIPASTRLEQVR